MNIAKRVSPVLNDFNGTAYVYEVDPPLAGYQYVIVSAANVPYSGPETYIFGARKAGNAVGVADWMELPGSYRGGLDHNQALRNAGYTVVP